VDGLAIALAAAAAVLFAVANNVQRGAASAVPLDAGGPVRLILRLIRTPHWVAGSLVALAALGLHAVALARGGIIVVQAILATGLIAALALEAFRESRWMRGGEVAGAGLLVAGVVLLLAWGRPGAGRTIDAGVEVKAALILAAVAAVGLTASRVRGRTGVTAAVMGAVAGVCFAVDAVYLRGVAIHLDDLDALPALTNLAGFALASMVGNVIVQRAYQRAPLRVTLPAVTAADPLAAFLIGRLMLGEHLSPGTAALTAAWVGIAAVVVGVVVTTTVASGGLPVGEGPVGGGQSGR
jgi:hypothetical protein